MPLFRHKTPRSGAVLTLGLALGLVGVAGCNRDTPAHPAPGTIACATSLPPIAYVIERVGGPAVRVVTLIGAGQSPHSYEPTPDQVVRLADARLFFEVGLPFEAALLNKVRSSRPDLRVVDTRRNIPLRRDDHHHDHSSGSRDHEHDHADHDHHDHAHDDHEGHDHAGHAHSEHADDKAAVPAHTHGEFDPHFWLDPLRLKTIAGTVADALAQADPARAADFQRNLTALRAELDQTHEALKKTLAPVAGRTLFVYHPAFGYFTDAYGLKQQSVEVEGKEPTPRELAATVDLARRAGVRVIFQEPQYPAQGARVLAEEVGAEVRLLDPYAGDCVNHFSRMGAEIAAALAQQTE